MKFSKRAQKAARRNGTRRRQIVNEQTVPQQQQQPGLRPLIQVVVEVFPGGRPHVAHTPAPPAMVIAALGKAVEALAGGLLQQQGAAAAQPAAGVQEYTADQLGAARSPARVLSGG